MGKTLKVVRPEGLNGNIDPHEIPAVLDSHGVHFHEIGCDNWNWSDSNPLVQFRIVHTSDTIILHFHVEDNEMRATETENDSRVWEDSCCEFFVSPDCNEFYYNFECNCIGTLLLHGGSGKDRPSASDEVYRSVKRWSSEGDRPFGVKEGRRVWDLVEIIPASALFRHSIVDLSGLTMRANFYKCGDLLTKPHFLSWAPVDLPRPMFHCPEFFSEIEFE